MKLDTNSGLVIQELYNGFLGREVTYFLWHGKRLIATSIDKQNWKMASSWVNKLVGATLMPITEDMYRNLTKAGDI